MNNDRGGFPDKGRRELSVLERRAIVPSTGLRELALPGEPVATGRSLDLAEIWRTIMKWRLLIAAIIFSSVLAAIILSLLITPIYRAESTIEINKETMEVIKGAELQPVMNDREYLNTQVALLKSRSLAERVARSLNLPNNPAFASPDAPQAARERAAAGAVQGAMKIDTTGDSRIIKLVVESADPSLAANLANSYADNFINSNLERRYEANSYARNFLQNRIAAVRAKLEQSEKALVQYAQQQGIVQLSTGGDSVNTGGGSTSLEAASALSLNEALSQARAERIAAEQRYRQSAGARAASDVIQSPVVQGLNQQRAQLQAEYQEKLGVFKPEFPAMVQLRSRIDSLTAEVNRQTRSVAGASSNSLRADYAAAVARENALQARVAGLKNSLLALREKSIDYTILQREVDTNRSLYDALLQRFKEVGVAGGVGENLVSVVDRAEVPTAPFSPNLPLNILLGLAAGVMLGFGAAFAIEFIDDTIKAPDDLTDRLGITPLGVIPMAPKGTKVTELLDVSRSEIAEAYHSVRTALQFATDHGIPRTMVITSARAAEGKSSTALALAQNLASLGASVLLVDADLRKPSFRGPPSATEGLSNMLAGSEKIREGIHQTDTERLFLLPGGQIPPNPAELLASNRLKTVLDQVSEWFDVVIVDAPPVLGLADAPLLASVCEGTLVVFEAGKTRRAAALNALRRLQSARANILGGILTKYNAKASGYGYGYGYGYGDEPYAYGKGEENKRQIELIS
jgi:capsular exopolysaccharide synthesis family protein